MKKILLTLLISLVACGTPQVREKPVTQCTPVEQVGPDKVIVRDATGKQVLELTGEEFRIIFGYSEKYVALLKLTKDEAALKKTIEVIRMSEDTNAVKIKINPDLIITSTVLINNEELHKLRAAMKRLHEQQPAVETTRINSTSFRVDMSIDDVKWTTVIDVTSVQNRFDWTSFWFGFGASTLLAAIVAIKAKAVIAALFFLL